MDNDSWIRILANLKTLFLRVQFFFITSKKIILHLLTRKKTDNSALTRRKLIRARESVNFWITTSDFLTSAIACDLNLFISLCDRKLIRYTLWQAPRLIENKNSEWHDYQTLTLISVVFGSAPINELSVLGPKMLIYWNEADRPRFYRESQSYENVNLRK